MDLLTVDEAAEILHVSAPTIRRFVASGRLPAVHVGRSVRIEREALGRIAEPMHANGRTVHPPYHAEAEADMWANYDPTRVRATLRALAGTLYGIDLDELKRDIRASRGQAVRDLWS